MKPIQLCSLVVLSGALVVAAACSDSHRDRPMGDPIDGGPGEECPAPRPTCYGTWGDVCCEDQPRLAGCDFITGTWGCQPGESRGAGCAELRETCDGPDVGPPPRPPYTSCDVPSDCTLVANTCCGVCGAPTRADVEAVSTETAMNYYLEVACPEAGAGSPPDCPDCPAALNPNLLATCTGERCVVVDLSAPGPLTRCTDDVDCIVRARDCCECGADVGVPNLVALHVDQRAQYESVVCDPDTACLECEPVYPDGVSAACNAGYCELVAMMSTP